MSTESKIRAGLPSQDEARAIVERARRLRAEALARMVRVAWSRIAQRRPVTMPLARA